MISPKTILISRTDSIGDVILTLPICNWLKQQFPSAKIIFLGNTYTQPILACLDQLDEIWEWSKLNELDEEAQIQFFQSAKIDVILHIFPRKEIARLAKKAKVPYRIGTSHRLFHWTTCNIRPNFTRKNSPLHESQLNFELLRPLGLQNIPSLNEISSSLTHHFKPISNQLPANIQSLLNNSQGKKIILHTKSQGSALEWPIEKYVELAVNLAKDGNTLFFSGTEKEGQLFRSFLPKNPAIHDISGTMQLDEFIYFISRCDSLVACSTGPLHIAGILGITTIGIYSTVRPIHPGRWKALGNNVSIVTNPAEDSAGKINPENIKNISVESVLLHFKK